jgi:hypothetical protein
MMLSLALRALPLLAAGSLGLASAVAHAQGAASKADVPPTEQSKLFEFLRAGSYRKWARESKPHPSAGPHPTQVQTYLNPALDMSLRAGNKSHPAGAAAVKELLGADGKLAGWAVSVKTDAASDGGRGWYWYEVFSTTDAGRTSAASKGAPLCFGCHTPGRDFVLIPHPLK